MKSTIDKAREAGLSIKDPQWGYNESHHVAGWLDNLKAFEALVRADERRANIACIGRIAALVGDPIDQARLFEAIDAIRARGETK